MMCVIIYKPQGVIVPKEILRKCWKRNPDGAGFMSVKDNKLCVSRGFFSFDKFYEAYAQVRRRKMVIHFRFASVGAVSYRNCHPLKVRRNLAFAHQGTIRKIVMPEGSRDSDSVQFNEQILRKLPREFYKNSAARALIQGYIGKGSKMVFMNNDGSVYISNEKRGSWIKKCWYSNELWKKLRKTKEIEEIVQRRFGFAQTGEIYEDERQAAIMKQIREDADLTKYTDDELEDAGIFDEPFYYDEMPSAQDVKRSLEL